MTDQQNHYQDFFCTGQFPEISDEVIDHIEDFLAFHVSSTNQFDFSSFISFYSSKYWEINQNVNLPDDISKRIRFRLIHAFRFIRPSLRDSQISQELLPIAFSNLQLYPKDSNNSLITRESFLFLIDHFISNQIENPEDSAKLLEFILNILSTGSNEIPTSPEIDYTDNYNLLTMDNSLILIIFNSFQSIISIFCKQMIPNLATIIGYLLRIALYSLRLQNLPQFFPDYEIIVAKSLRILAFLTEKFHNFTDETNDFLFQIQKSIPNDVRFIHIYQNFLMFVCKIIDLACQPTMQPSLSGQPNQPMPIARPNLSSLLEKKKDEESPVHIIIEQIMSILPLFTHQPFNKSRRVLTFFQTFQKLVQNKNTSGPDFNLSKVMPLFGHLQGQTPFLKICFDFFIAYLTPDYLSKPGVQLDLFEQFETCIEMIKDEFDSIDFESSKYKNSFDSEYWLESNTMMIKSMTILLRIKDHFDVSIFSRTEIMIKLFDYIDYYFDITGLLIYSRNEESPQYTAIFKNISPNKMKEKVLEFINSFINLLSKLPGPILNYLITFHLYSLLPKKSYHGFHFTLITNMTRAFHQFKDKTQLLSGFLISFFSCAVKHFDDLFLPTPCNYELNLVQRMFSYIDPFIKPQDQQQIQQLCDILRRFFNMSIASRQNEMIILISTLLRMLAVSKPESPFNIQQQQQQPKMQPNVTIKPQPVPATEQHKMAHSASTNPTMALNQTMLQAIRAKASAPLQNKGQPTPAQTPTSTQQGQQMKMMPNGSMGPVNVQTMPSATIPARAIPTPTTNQLLRHKLDPLFKTIQESSRSYYIFIKKLIDDPKFEISASTFAIHIFPFLISNIETVEVWISFFLPALENDLIRPKVIQPVYEILTTSKIRDRDSTLQKLFKAISKDPAFINHISSKFPDSAISQALYKPPVQIPTDPMVENEPGSIIVTYGPELQSQINEESKDEYIQEEKRKQKLPYSVILHAMEKVTKPADEQFDALLVCFISFISQLNFLDSVSCRLVHDTCELYQKNGKIEMILDSYQQANCPKTKYSLLYLREKYGTESIENLVTNNTIINDPSDFISYINVLCTRNHAVSTASKIISYILPILPNDKTYANAITTLLQATPYAPKLIKTIFQEHFYSRHFDAEADAEILEMFKVTFYTAAFDALSILQKKLYKISIRALDFVLNTLKTVNFIDQQYKKLIPEIPKLSVDPTPNPGEPSPMYKLLRCEFIFLRPFSDVADPELALKILKQFSLIDLSKFDDTTRRALNVSANIDKPSVIFETAKFFLKAIMKMLPYMKPGSQIWEQLFPILRSEKMKAILPFFYKQIKKNAHLGYHSMPSNIVPILQTKIASTEYNSNQNSSNSTQLNHQPSASPIPSPNLNIRSSSPSVNQSASSKQQAAQQQSTSMAAVLAAFASSRTSNGFINQQVSPSKKTSKSTNPNQQSALLNISSAQIANVLSNLNQTPITNANLLSAVNAINQQSQMGAINTPDDIKLARIAIEYSLQPQLVSYIQWMISVINSYQNDIQTGQYEKIQNGLIEIFRTIKVIKKIEYRVDLSPLFTAILDFVSKTRKSISTIQIPIYKLGRIDPLLTIHSFISILNNNWDADLFNLGCSIFEHKKCIDFRKGIVEALYTNLPTVIKYITKNASNDADFVSNRTFEAIAYCFDNLSPQEINIFDTFKLSKKLFEEILNKEFKLNYLFCFTRIFLPKRFAHEIESDPEMFQYYKSDILPLFIFAPKHFYHPLFPRKFVEFMKMLSLPARLDIWMNTLPALQINPNGLFAPILVNQLKAELYSAFPGVDKEDEEKIPRREIRIGFSDYRGLRSNIFISYLLHYSGSMIGLMNPQLKITDLADNPLSEVSSQVHALFIRDGLKDGSSIRTVQRFANIARSLSQYNNIDEDKYEDEDFESFVTSLDSSFKINYDHTLVNIFSITPFVTKQNNNCFKMFTNSDFIIKKPSKHLMRYLVSIITNNIETSRQVSSHIIATLPHVLKTFNSNDVHFSDERFLELSMYAATLLLEKFDDSLLPKNVDKLIELLRTGQYLPSALELYVKVDFSQINHELLLKVRKLLKDNKLYEIPTQADGVQLQKLLQFYLMKMKFVYQIIISLAPILYHADDDQFLPDCILPSKLWMDFYFPQGKKDLKKEEMLSLYQKVVRSSVESGGFRLSNQLISYIYNNNKSKLSKPLKTPFATLTEWTKIKELGQDRNLTNILKIMLNPLTPTTKENFLLEALHFKQPLHKVILISIEELQSTLDIQSLFEHFPSLYQLSVKYIPKDDISQLLNAAFHIDWLILEESTHLATFARLLLPDVFHALISFLRESEIQDIVLHNIIEIDSSITKFIAFYVYSFPHSSLSNVLSLHPLFSQSDPYPGCSLYENMSYLDSRNDWSDSLGLLQTHFPKLLSSTSFHEIGNYTAARYTYMIDMMPTSFLSGISNDRSGFKTKYEHNAEDFYFHALNKLRSCYLNETLPSTPNLRDYVLKVINGSTKITLPILQDVFRANSIMEGQLTSFISPSYIPLYYRSSIYEEIKLDLSVYRDKKINPDLFRLSGISIRSLDHLNAMISNFTWRFSILDDISSTVSALENNPLPNAVNTLYKCVRFNHKSDAYLLAASNSFKYALKEMEKGECYDSNDAAKEMGKSDYFELTDVITKNNLPRIFNFLKRNPKITSLRWDSLLILRDIKTVLQYPHSNLSKKQRVKLFISITQIRDMLNLPNIISPASMATSLFQELSKCDYTDKYVILSLLIKYIKKDEELKQLFKEYHDDSFDLFLEWLPILFQHCGPLPVEFMSKLLKSNTTYFYLQIHQLNNSGLIQDKKYLSEIMHKSIKIINESIEYITKSFDITKTVNSIELINYIYRAIQRPELKTLPESVQKFGQNITELSEFINSTQPVFHAKTPNTFYISGMGYRLPRMPQTVIRMKIESDGVNEAHLKYTTIRGETKTYLLLPYKVYKNTCNEFILTRYLNHLIMPRNESSSMIYYPQTFLVYHNLCLVDAPDASNLQNICRPYSIYEFLHSVANTDGDNSPKDLVERRKNNSIPSDLLFKWFVKGSKGNKNNFLFMRRSFALHLGTSSYLHALFRPKEIVIPSVIFLNDRQRVAFSGFMDINPENGHKISDDYPPLWNGLCLSPQIARLLPEFVLRGSFATSWHTIADSIVKALDSFGLVLEAILPIENGAARVVDSLSQRANLMGNQVSEDTDKSDEYFPFLVLNHLIETAQNNLIAETRDFGWV